MSEQDKPLAQRAAAQEVEDWAAFLTAICSERGEEAAAALVHIGEYADFQQRCGLEERFGGTIGEYITRAGLRRELAVEHLRTLLAALEAVQSELEFVRQHTREA